MSITRYTLRTRRDPHEGIVPDAIEAPNGAFVRFEDHCANMLTTRNEWGTDQAFRMAEAKDKDTRIADLTAKLSAAEARIGRLQREVMARRAAEASLGWGGADELSRCAAQVCDKHNDLQPPTADNNNAAQPQKD